MSASSNALEASIPAFEAAKEGDVASSPSPLSNKQKIGKQVFCLPWVKCSRSHPLCIYRVAISASSDELEASIAAFSATEEGDVASSPSPLVNN